MSTRNTSTHFLDGHGYLVDEHRIIREPGRFKDQPIYAPYFWNAYIDGTYDDEYYSSGVHVIVFSITEDDRFDYPELASALTLDIWEDLSGIVRTRLGRQG